MKRHWQNFQQVRGAQTDVFAPISLPDTHNQAPLPNDFTLLVWNVYKRNGGEQFDADLTDLSARSHLLCLQEVLASDQADLPQFTQALSHHYSVSYKRQDGLFEGVYTASHHPLDERCEAIQSLGREPVTQTPKSALLTTATLASGQTLLVINIHMLLFKNTFKFRREILQVMKASKVYKNQPAIFCGDFNTFTPWQLYWLDTLLKPFGFTRLKPEHRPRRAGFLDHIYVRGLKARRFEILDTISSSDHLPLLCELSISEA